MDNTQPLSDDDICNSEEDDIEDLKQKCKKRHINPNGLKEVLRLRLKVFELENLLQYKDSFIGTLQNKILELSLKE